MEPLGIFELIVLVFEPSTLLFWFSLTALKGICCQGKSSDKRIARYLLGTKRQTDKVSNNLMNTVEHLADKEPDISGTKTELK